MLSPKQTLFVENYLVSSNATDAAKKAGYSEKTAYSQGQRLLKKVEVQERIGKRLEQAIITADEILQDVKSIAKSAEKDSDRLKGYELLGKHLKLWIDKTEHSGPDNGPIQTVVVLPK